MNENTITITLDEYRSLIAKAEQIEVLGRFMAVNDYVNINEIKAILGINEAKES